MIGGFVAEWEEILNHAIAHWPGRTGRALRAWRLKRKARRVGKNITVGIGVEITGVENVEIGSDVIIMRFATLAAHDGEIKIGNNVGINANTCIGAANGGRIVIGDNVLIAQNVVLRASNHEHRSTEVPILAQGHRGGEIIVEDDVWICANAVITANVKIGAHSIVAAGSVVTDDVEPYSLVGGVPARLIRKRHASAPGGEETKP